MPIYKMDDKIFDPQKYPWGYLDKKWSPLDEGDNLIAYFSADSENVIINESNQVQEWHDQGPLLLTATPASANLPIYSSEFNCIISNLDRAVFYFNSVSASLIVVCCRFESTRNYSSLLSPGSPWPGGTSTLLYNHTTTDPVRYGDGYVNGGFVAPLSMGRYLNNDSIYSFIPTAPAVVNGNGDHNASFPTRSFLGRHYDIILFGENTESMTDLRLKTEGYIAHKRGMTDLLGLSHPYKSTAP